MTAPPERTLSTLLAEIGKGTADSDATQAIREVVQAVGDTGKKGTVTITVTITPPDNDPDQHTFDLRTGEIR